MLGGDAFGMELHPVHRPAGMRQPHDQVIRRFRDLEMPLDDIQAVLNAPDLDSRNKVIASHLTWLEANLSRTQDAVASLRDLLEPPTATPSIHHRHLPATPAAAITETVQAADALIWFRGALGELGAMLAAQHLDPAGPAGGDAGCHRRTGARW